MPESAQTCPDLPSEPESTCCEPTIALVVASGQVRRCPMCRTEYFPERPSSVDAAPLPARPGRDLRDGDVPEPTGRHSIASAAADDSPEVVAVRRLLCELRPRGAGPDDDPEATPVVRPSPPLREQGGMGGHGGVPKGSFGRTLTADELDVPQRIGRVASVDPRAAVVLSHLRLKGTLRAGYGALCVGVAHAIAEGERRQRWDRDADRAWDRAKLWGASRVTEAIAAWEAAA